MAQLIIYGNIVTTKKNETDVSAIDVKAFIRQLSPNEPLDIFINSFGGEVTNGLAIYQTIKAHQGPKKVYVDGAACSIASVIAFAGDELFMAESALLMVHLPYTGIVGNKFELQREIQALESIEESLLMVYNANLRSQSYQQKVKQMVYEETWLTGKEAAQYFTITLLDTQTISSKVAAAAGTKTILSQFKKTGNNPSSNQFLKRFQKNNGAGISHQQTVLDTFRKQAANTQHAQTPPISKKVEDTKKSILDKLKK